MISKDIATQVLEQCLITGGDFAEIFEEDSITNNIGLIDSKIENVLGGRNYGIGIRIFKGFKSVYAYTNDNSLRSMLDTAYKAALALGRVQDGKQVVLNNSKITTDINPIKLNPNSVDYQHKILHKNYFERHTKEYVFLD